MVDRVVSTGSVTLNEIASHQVLPGGGMFYSSAGGTNMSTVDLIALLAMALVGGSILSLLALGNRAPKR